MHTLSISCRFKYSITSLQRDGYVRERMTENIEESGNQDRYNPQPYILNPWSDGSYAMQKNLVGFEKPREK
jgi:hypothetical protein